MNNKGKLLAAVLAIVAGVGLAIADQNPTSGTVARAVYDVLSGRNMRLDGVNDRFVFGSTTPATGAVLTSSGTVVVQSTSPTSSYPFFRLLNNARTALVSLTQGGALTVNGTIAATSYTGDGSALQGVLATGSTVTATGSWYFANSVSFSSPTTSFNIGPNTTVTISTSIGVSTFTQLNTDYSATTNAMGVSVAGSTITLVLPYASYLRLTLNGGAADTYSDSDSGGCNFILDGNYVPPFTKTRFVFSPDNSPAARAYFPAHFEQVTLTPVAAGTHTISLSCVSDAGGTRGLVCSGTGITAKMGPCILKAATWHDQQ
jgi:hypothetical protein